MHRNVVPWPGLEGHSSFPRHFQGTTNPSYRATSWLPPRDARCPWLRGSHRFVRAAWTDILGGIVIPCGTSHGDEEWVFGPGFRGCVWRASLWYMCLAASISSEVLATAVSWWLQTDWRWPQLARLPAARMEVLTSTCWLADSSTALRYGSWKQLLPFTQQAHNCFSSLAALSKTLMISDQSHSASTLGLSPEMCSSHENHTEKLRRIYHICWLKGPGSLRTPAWGPWATSDSLGFLPQQSRLIGLLQQRILCLPHLTRAKDFPPYVSTHTFELHVQQLQLRGVNVLQKSNYLKFTGARSLCWHDLLFSWSLTSWTLRASQALSQPAVSSAGHVFSRGLVVPQHLSAGSPARSALKHQHRTRGSSWARPDRLRKPFWNAFRQAAPLPCLAVPSEDVLKTTTTYMYTYPVCITRGCPVLLLEDPPQVLSSSATFVPRNHKPAPVYTAAALTGYHSSGVRRQCCVPSKHLTRFFLETYPCSASLLTCSLSPVPPYSSPSPHPILLLFARPFSLEKAQFPFGGD